MPIKIDFDEAQLTALESKLAELAIWDRGRAMRQALAAAGKPIVAKWEQLAPQPGRAKYTGPGKGRRRSGHGLADAIGSKAISWKQAAGATLIVGADYKVAPHEHLVELGHEIVPGRSVRSAFRGRTIVAPEPVMRAMGLRGRSRSISRGGRVPGGFYGKTAVETTRGEFEQALFGSLQREVNTMIDQFGTNGAA